MSLETEIAGLTAVINNLTAALGQRAPYVSVTTGTPATAGTTSTATVEVPATPETPKTEKKSRAEKPKADAPKPVHESEKPKTQAPEEQYEEILHPLLKDILAKDIEAKNNEQRDKIKAINAKFNVARGKDLCGTDRFEAYITELKALK